ncbi:MULTISPECIES: cellulase family glycosylhydrolase [unclassified Caballeronia]|uniref:cellulase family glycosylhydrolase n=1 Tax=unclassified Caballeronia TaxID=2646786 RepID=UPI002854C7CD|nr:MULTISPECIES: cellulase family glycosylhydrolase [unclassified Caballeronia]MDR5752647.1 cellulase family glycosylhydrolase [Caballeronia sp. LZ024]MDR5841289.1 cellulase family glycosylhydrolase [Caballeronia sp. LZ031]
MPAVFTSHALSRSGRLAGVIAFAALASAAQSAFAADAAMRVLNAPGSLIMDGPGTKRVDLQVAPQAGAGSNLIATLYRYDADGKPSDTPVTTYQASASGGKASFNVAIPAYGLYLLDAKLQGGSGAELKINMAAITAGGAGFTDAGVITHFGQHKGNPAVVLPLVKKAGFNWIRDELYWSEVEKTAGNFSFPADYTNYVTQAAKLNLKPLIILDYSNRKAYPNLLKGPQGFPVNQQERDLFVRYAQKLVGMYGKQVKHWEIWNEPAFPKVSYENYAALLKDVYPAIKKVSPDSTVISCGGGGAGGGPGGDCIVALIKAGVLDYQDGFSIHPYMSPHDPDSGYPAKGAPVNPVNIPNVWPHLARMMNANPRQGHAKLKVWITEIGWPSSPQSAGLSEPSQAANIARTYLLSRRYDEATEGVFWYDFVDDGVDPNNKESNFGMLRADLTPKPAYVAASVVMKTLGARKWARALIDSRDVKVYQYGADNPVYVGWQTGSNESAASVQIPPGKYTQRNWQGATSTVTVPSGGFQWQLGALPKYLIPAGQSN